MDILQYTFFQNALIGIILLSTVAAIIGTYIVTRRMVFIAGGITHASFGGMGIGYYAGISPTLAAMAFAILSALGIEQLSRGNKLREDSAIAIFWALGMAVGIIFIFLTPGYTPGLTEFLFGNILTITHTDITLFATYTVALVIWATVNYRRILYTIFDRDFASTQGINVKYISTIMTLFIAIGVVLSIRLVGIMLLISILTLPQSIAEMHTAEFKKIILLSGVICLICNLIGLTISAIVSIPTGACIVVTLVITYMASKLSHLINLKIQQNKTLRCKQ
ncbi:MAG: metal ABC transporter permease [Bacteroidaceae bacterium]|nr:metal ABC transporter permease [Bacteroidaceae bacterium]